MKRFYGNDLPLVRASGLSGFAGRGREREREREKKKEKKINSRDASTKEMGRKNYKENFNAPTVKNCYYEFCSCKNKFNLFLA